MQDAVDLSNFHVFLPELEEQKAIAMNLRAMEMFLHKESFIECLRTIFENSHDAFHCSAIKNFDIFCPPIGDEDLSSLSRNWTSCIHEYDDVHVYCQLKSFGAIGGEASFLQSPLALLTSCLHRRKACRQNSRAERQRPAHLFDEAYAECLNDCFSRYKTWLKSKRRQATRLVRLSLPSHRREVRPLAREAQITGLLSIRQPCAP